MNWFRLYTSIVNDPSVLKLRPDRRWHYIACLCVADRESGSLPDVPDIAVHLRVKPAKAALILDDLAAAGLVREDPETGRRSIQGWDAAFYGMGRRPQ